MANNCGTCAHGRFERTPKGRIKGSVGVCDCPLPAMPAMPSSVTTTPPQKRLVSPKDGRDCPLWALASDELIEVTVFKHQPFPGFTFSRFHGNVAVFDLRGQAEQRIPVPESAQSRGDNSIVRQDPRELDIILKGQAVIQAWHWVVKVAVEGPTVQAVKAGMAPVDDKPE